MAIHKRNRFSGFVVLCVFSCFLRTTYAGSPSLTPSALVGPGGVEIPVLVNVLGPESPVDQLNVDQAFIAANDILRQANVQLNVAGYKAGVEIGNGDRLLAEAEHDEALRRVVPVPRPPWDPINGNAADPLKGPGWGKRLHHGCPITIYIADDVWVERPDTVLWNAAFFPAAFLELDGQPQEAGRILAREIASSAGLSPSGDSGNLLFPDGTGSRLDDPDQTVPIRVFAEQIGHVRSPLADGFADGVLESLRCPPRKGALFHSEVVGRWGDEIDDVTREDAGGSTIGPGRTDLESYTAKTGTIGADPSEREVVLKAVFNGVDLHETIGVDTFIRRHGHGDDTLTGDAFLDNDAVIGFGPDFVGGFNLRESGDWLELPGATVDVDMAGNRTRIKAVIPILDLSSILPGDVFDALVHGDPLDLTVGASTFIFDDTGFTVEQDAIWYIELGACPKPLRCVTEEGLLEDVDPATLLPGIDVRTALIENPADIPADESPRDTLDGLFDDLDPSNEAGRDVVDVLNFGTNLSTDHGLFGSPQGAPDQPYPGIPLSPDGDRLFGTEARGVIDLDEGLHVFGIHGDDRAVLKIGGVEVARTFRDHPGPHGGDNGDGMPPDTGDQGDEKPGLLKRGDAPFEVKRAGLFPFELRALGSITGPSGNGPQTLSVDDGSASLEVSVVLPDGTRVLLGDTAGGSPPLFILPGGGDSPDEPDEPDTPDDPDDPDDDPDDPDDPGDPADLVVYDFENRFSIGPEFRSRGDAGWFIVTSGGNSVARSGTITDAETSTMELSVNVGAGEIAFDYWVSTESGFDVFRFFIDGQEQRAWSGETQGTASFPVKAGDRVFAWTYQKDGSDAGGSDQVRVDNVTHPAPGP